MRQHIGKGYQPTQNGPQGGSGVPHNKEPIEENKCKYCKFTLDLTTQNSSGSYYHVCNNLSACFDRRKAKKESVKYSHDAGILTHLELTKLLSEAMGMTAGSPESFKLTDRVSVMCNIAMQLAYEHGRKTHLKVNQLKKAIMEQDKLFEKLDEAMASPERIKKDTVHVGGFVSLLNLTETADEIVDRACGRIKALNDVTERLSK